MEEQDKVTSDKSKNKKNHLDSSSGNIITSDSIKSQSKIKGIESFGSSKFEQPQASEEVVEKLKDLFKEDLDEIVNKLTDELEQNKKDAISSINDTKVELEQNKKDAISSLNDTKKDFLVIFGLFASFVTFISLNVQILNKSNDIFELVGLCFISLSLILIFALTIHNATNEKTALKNHFTLSHGISLTLLILGITFLWYGGYINEKKSDYENRLNENKNKIDSIKNELNTLKGISEMYESRIIELSNEVNMLKVDSVK